MARVPIGKRGRQVGILVALGVLLGLGCAEPLPPPGGPVDQTPPWLVSASPESAAVGLRDVTVLDFRFSEKMDRKDAYAWLTTFPRVTVAKTNWHGAREATVKLAEPLPADTVIVVEVAASLRDAHNVAQRAGRRWAIATADSLPRGAITGGLVMDGKPLGGGVAELFAVPPETLLYYQQPPLRRTVADSSGQFRFAWLPVPSGPYLVRAFRDNNGDLRPAEGEAQRLLPDTVRVTVADPAPDLGTTTLYGPATPGQLVGHLDGRPRWPGTVMAFVLKIAENDTGWVPAPQRKGLVKSTVVADTGRTVIPGAGPGLVRAIFYVDADGDSLLSAMPRTPGDSTGAWVLEPWALDDSLEVEPGLDTTFPPPVWPDTLTTWPSPVATAADTSGAAADSTARRPAEGE